VKGKLIYISIDWLAAIVAWIIFFSYRKSLETPWVVWQDHFQDPKLIEGLVVIPLVWICIWWLLGAYRGVYFQSRLQMVYKTAIGAVIGALGLLFTALRDDLTLSYITYVQLFLAVFLIHFGIFVLIRLFLLTVYKYLTRSRVVSLHGHVWSDQPSHNHISHGMLDTIVRKNREELTQQSSAHALIVDVSNQDQLRQYLPGIIGYASRKPLFMTQSSFEQLPVGYTGTPSLSHDLIALDTSPIQAWQENIKRVIDIVGALVIMILGSPLMLWMAIGVRSSSTGPILYSQKRRGRFGQEFDILKFRSMIDGAESQGPQLADNQDARTTSFGRWMRRWRLDELPQCLNVLKGEMSLVGPRPERPFYADQLIALQPKYALIYQVRPGITSWGQIKFGYASTLDEMLQRFRFDLLYMEHMSLLLDFRILCYTIVVLFQGKGR